MLLSLYSTCLAAYTAFVLGSLTLYTWPKLPLPSFPITSYFSVNLGGRELSSSSFSCEELLDPSSPWSPEIRFPIRRRDEGNLRNFVHADQSNLHLMTYCLCAIWSTLQLDLTTTCSNRQNKVTVWLLRISAETLPSSLCGPTRRNGWRRGGKQRESTNRQSGCPIMQILCLGSMWNVPWWSMQVSLLERFKKHEICHGSFSSKPPCLPTRNVSCIWAQPACSHASVQYAPCVQFIPCTWATPMS